MDQIIQHLLEARLQQQMATQELARGVRVLSEDLLASRQAASSPPLPSPKQTAHHLLTKLTLADDIKAYLHMFKVMAEREVWDRAVGRDPGPLPNWRSPAGLLFPSTRSGRGLRRTERGDPGVSGA
ncbi:hypothetical protein MHYP_G00362650 [Metynnis hypsauchen]